MKRIFNVKVGHYTNYFMMHNKEVISTASIFSDDGGSSVLLCGVFTEKEFRKQGLATSIINYIIKKYHNKTICLEVGQDNETKKRRKELRSFYRQFGFYVCGKNLMKRKPTNK